MSVGSSLPCDARPNGALPDNACRQTERVGRCGAASLPILGETEGSSGLNAVR